MTTRKQLIDPEQLSADARRLYDFLNDEKSDVALVVVAAAFLDATLAALLAAFMIRGNTTTGLLTPDGPIGAFHVRARLAYALALISKSDCQDLCKVAEIRNQFAHSHLQLSFTDTTIQKLCGELKAGIAVMSEDVELAAKVHFVISVVLLSQRLLANESLCRGEVEAPLYPRWMQLKQKPADSSEP